MYKGHKTLIELLLVELPTLDLLRKFVLCTWHSRVQISAISPTVFKIMIRNLQQSKNIGLGCT